MFSKGTKALVAISTLCIIFVVGGCASAQSTNTSSVKQGLTVNSQPIRTTQTVTVQARQATPTPAPPPTPQPTSPTFHGYDCTEDCSGHEAGYEWAEEHGITDPADCGGNSASFIEGCEVYAEEHAEYEEDFYEDEYYEDDYYQGE